MILTKAPNTNDLYPIGQGENSIAFLGKYPRKYKSEKRGFIVLPLLVRYGMYRELFCQYERL